MMLSAAGVFPARLALNEGVACVHDALACCPRMRDAAFRPVSAYKEF